MSCQDNNSLLYNIPVFILCLKQALEHYRIPCISTGKMYCKLFQLYSMNKQEHDQFLHDSVMYMLKQKSERQAASAPKIVIKKKNAFASFWEKLLRYFTS
jgi:hypothetical protein